MSSVGDQDAIPVRREGGALPDLVRTGTAALFAAILVQFTAGCFSPPKPPPPPPAVLNFGARKEGVEIVVHTLITMDGPQAWLPDPTWDEYVVTITNGTGAPLQLESVQVIDQLGRVSEGSPDPVVLTARSQENWKAYGKAKLQTYPQYLPVYNDALVLGAAVLIVVTPVLAIDVPLAIVANAKRQSLIQQEFPVRRLDLARPLAPGESALGSVFVPLAVGPRRLEFRVKSGANPVLLAIPLPGLSRLHLAGST